MALVIDQAWDLFMSQIESVNPRTNPDIKFKRHRAPVDLLSSNGAVRYFQIKIPTVLPNDFMGPRSDGVSEWYGSEQFLIKIWYPQDWVISGDSTARGVDWIKMQDTIDLNEALCYNDFLSALGDSYESPQFKGAYQEGLLWVLQYRFVWQELFS